MIKGKKVLFGGSFILEDVDENLLVFFEEGVINVRIWNWRKFCVFSRLLMSLVRSKEEGIEV